MNHYQECTRCVMDTSAKDITFDKNGICNYCTEFLKNSSDVLDDSEVKKTENLNKLIELIKTLGKGKPYDCIIGVSGGVDSSWVLVQAKRLGLRPLAVHMDNGWNTQLAENNINNLVKALDIDLYTQIIDRNEYNKLLQSFFEADVIDLELIYDNAMLAVNYQQANKYGLKYILSGSNQATEGMRIPSTWNWFKYDKKNIFALADRVGLTQLTTCPTIGVYGYIYNRYFKGIKWVSFLDYTDYNKFHALDELEAHYDYERYPFKHYESIFTRLYQGYILPNKFGVDKRRVHLATLVAAGQMTRAEAKQQLQGIAYLKPEDLEADIDYFLQTMGWTRAQLDTYIKRREVLHSAYPSEKKRMDLLGKYYRFFRGR